MTSPDLDQKSSRQLPDMSLENARLVETLLILQKNLDVFLLELVDSVSRSTFPVHDLSHKVVLFNLRLGIFNFHHFEAISPL